MFLHLSVCSQGGKRYISFDADPPGCRPSRPPDAGPLDADPRMQTPSPEIRSAGGTHPALMYTCLKKTSKTK